MPFSPSPARKLEMDEVVIRGVKTRVWKNAPPSLREVIAGRHAVHATGPSSSMRTTAPPIESFYRAAVAFAEALQARGVKKGDRVAIIMRNLPEWVAAFYGAAIIGAIVTPLNAWWTGPELEYGLVDSGAQRRRCRCRAAGAHRRAHRQLSRISKRVYVSRYDDDLPHPIVHAPRRCAGQRQRLGQAARSRRCRMWRSTPTTMRRSFTPPARPASRRARSAPIAT